uniref:Sodefrin-like factor C n=1 Tax=Hyloscirtus phyllognathus TaxID=371702 RepID=A0A513ZV81_9NEOB|nr:sodefrin precursor-like factor C [Hyloscirtus phyllognathus]
MKHLAILVFAMSGITIGEALRCLECKAEGKTNCPGQSVECMDKNDFCVTSIEYDILYGNLTPTIRRGCMNVSKVCDGTIAMNSTGYQLMFHNDCCYTDNCNSGEIKMPKLNTTGNGLQCPSCFVEGGYECNSHQPVSCSGNQRDCFIYIGKGYIPGTGQNKYYYIAGCTTGDTCEFGPLALVGAEVGVPRILMCKAAQNME